MKYLIYTNDFPPFFTDYYEYNNHYNPDIEMKVFDLINKKYTEDGISWKNIETDHL